TDIPLNPGDNSQNNNFGELPQAVAATAQVSGFVKCVDLPGDPGIAGVTITLVNEAAGAVAGTATTDANGFFQFTNLAPGTYRLEEGAVPATFTSDGVIFVVTDGRDVPGAVNGVTDGTVGPNNGIGTDFIANIVLT